MDRWKKWAVLCAAAAYLAVYIFVSYRNLLVFPFVHSDESWLAGLSRDMLAAGNLGVTESFFDAKPRVPHAMKSLFHIMQMGAVGLGGFSVGSVRMLSLLAGIICLVLFYLCVRRMGSRWFALGLTVLLSLDIQFIYASHFARQEIFIALELLVCLWILLGKKGRPGTGTALILGVVTGLFVGIHPNSFLCAAVCGAIMVFEIVRQAAGKDKKGAVKTLGSLAAYTAAVLAVTAVYVGISFQFNPHFLPDYFLYGKEEFELSSSGWARVGELFSFFSGVYGRDNGTYYLPDVRLEMIAMALAAGLSAAACLVMRGDAISESEALGGESVPDSEEERWIQNTRVILEGAAGLAAGMVVIGRYNQTAVLFFFLFGWLLAGQVLQLFEKAGRTSGILILAAGLAVGSIWQIQNQRPGEAENYASYLDQLAELVPADAPTIGNLNMEFYFDRGMLKDYRNLPYVEGGVETYIRENQIEYICYSDELDYLYEHRPYFHAIYGNAAFVRELKAFCETACREVGRIHSLEYASRVNFLRGAEEWGTVRVYRVKQEKQEDT